jgi:hypothetical protein
MAAAAQETSEVAKMSARVLGGMVGLTAEEMNQALRKAGVLYGEPNAYGLTELGAKFAAERFYKRGTGGYSFMNPEWTERIFDPAVLDVVDLSAEAKRQIAREVKENRLARQAAKAAAQKAAAAAAEASRREVAATPTGYRLTPAGRILVAGLVGYGIYRTVPGFRGLWTEKAVPGLKGFRDRVRPTPHAQEEPVTDRDRQTGG